MGPGGPRALFRGLICPPGGGVAKTVVIPGGPIFGPRPAEKSLKTIVNMHILGELGFSGGARQER